MKVLQLNPHHPSVMAESTPKSPMRCEKDRLGCKWGLICIFDLCHDRYTRRLLANRMCMSGGSDVDSGDKSKLNLLTNSNENNEHMDDGDECKMISVDFDGESVKKDIDEDMSSLKYLMKRIPDLNIIEKPSCNLDELNMQLVQKRAILREELGDVTESFLNQKLIDVEQCTRDGELLYSNEFMDALEILKSNKELFVELSQDPKSVLGKHIQVLRNALADKLPSKSREKSELSEEIADSKQFKQIQRKTLHNFFGKKNQTQGSIPSMGCGSSQSSNIQNSTTLSGRLRNQGESKRAAYNFFLRKMKRKFKHTIGEGRNESILHRLQYQHKDSGEITETDFVATCNVKETPNFSVSAKRGDKGGKSEDKNFPARRARTTLGTFLSLPESNLLSPKLSHVKDDEPSFAPEPMRIFLYDNGKHTFQSEQEKSGSILSPSRQNVEESPSIRGDLSLQGRLDIIEITNIPCIEESNQSDVEEGSSKCLRVDPSQEKPSIVSSSLGSSSPHIHENGALESISKKPEQPSPVSVLEPFLLEDVTSPASSVAQNAELPMLPPLQINFEEPKAYSLEIISSNPEICLTTCAKDKELEFNYIRTLLEASGLTSTNEFFARWHSLEQPINQSLFDEVELLSIRFPEDRKILFDSLNEVLVEVYGLFFISPFLSFFKLGFRRSFEGNNVLREVWKCLDWLIILEFPLTLDQIVRKDMEKEGSWMDLQYNIEEIGIVVGENILEELMEDTLFKLFQTDGDGDDDDDDDDDDGNIDI